jgi:carbamoyltransferase
MKDGEIVAAMEEERFSRIKHAPSQFPKESITFCLRRAGISQEEVNYVVYARLTPLRTFCAVLLYYLRRPPRTLLEVRYTLASLKLQAFGTIGQFRGRAGYQRIRTLFPKLPKAKTSFDHHLCHAASAYLLSPFGESLIITWDGKGEATSLSIGIGNRADLSIKERRGIFDSLGLFYSAATTYLGFTPNDGEYKVMGLAPYGQRGTDVDDLIVPDELTGYRVNSNFVLYPLRGVERNFERTFGPPAIRDAPISKEHQNFAWALQNALERVGLSIAKMAQKKYPSRHLCLAGGVALNVKLNKVLRESGLFDDIFVQPAAGDNGLVLGAVALLYSRLTGKRPFPLKHLYLGTEYSDDEVASILCEEGVKFHRSSDVIGETAALITSGNIIAWFQGRMEFGPRSLGARSILAHPGIAGMRDRINEKIKFREEFRPFCPSILAEHADELLEKSVPSPFMILSFDATSTAERLVPAVVHVDNTVRPQTVAQDGSRYRALIERFYHETGVPALLNTSLNIRGEPIVENPHQVAEFFRKTNVDVIVAGDSIALRTDQDTRIFQTLSRETLNTQY